MADIRIGTSSWHYSDWEGLFYPAGTTGYNELTFHAAQFTTVENNSSFYRIASEPTYKTWDKATPPGYLFSLKLNKLITHTHRLELTDEAQEKIAYILATTQVLGPKRGAILLQLPASFHADLPILATFLAYCVPAVRNQEFPFSVAVEFRHSSWFTPQVYALLKKYNVALVAAHSSRWPGVREVTADIAYIRMHGPEKLFASSYSTAQLTELADYIKTIAINLRRVYVYFNNDFHGYALQNARELQKML